ncbi:MAG: sigma-70 family RNA polymerase sigma factor [Bacteroidota bacterium]
MSAINQHQQDHEVEIREGGVVAERAISQIFSNSKYLIDRYHRRYKTLLSREDVSDIFTDALLVYIRLVKEGAFTARHERAAIGFIQQTMRFRIIDQMRRLSNLPYLEDLAPLENIWHQPIRDILDWELVNKCLDHLPKRGRRILKLWMEGYQMEEIAEKVGLANANSVAVTKCHTLKKVVKMYQEEEPSMKCTA